MRPAPATKRAVRYGPLAKRQSNLPWSHTPHSSLPARDVMPTSTHSDSVALQRQQHLAALRLVRHCNPYNVAAGWDYPGPALRPHQAGTCPHIRSGWAAQLPSHPGRWQQQAGASEFAAGADELWHYALHDGALPESIPAMAASATSCGENPGRGEC